MGLQEDLSVVDLSFWGGFENGDCDNMLDLFDFPMESLEGDSPGECWDDTIESLGHIPSQVATANGPSDKLPDLSVLRGRVCQPQQPARCEEKPNSKFPLDSSKGKENSGLFQAPSPPQILDSSSSSSVQKPSSQSPVLVRSRSKRVRRPSSNPWFITYPLSPSDKISQPKRPKAEKKIREEIFAETKEDSYCHSNTSARKCAHCEVTKTPQWREGPSGPKTLCNACGVRYRSGRLFPEYRPAASPTFIPTLHSNSHRKVVEMRRKNISESGIADPKSPESPPLPPEFVPVDCYFFDRL